MDDDMPEQYLIIGRFMLHPHPENGIWLTDIGTGEAMQVFQPEVEQLVKTMWQKL